MKSLLGANLSRLRGFSLIELMVAMLVGLIVLNGVIQVVLNSKRSYLDNQAMSQIQENARYALDTLARDIRMAGYFGCAEPADRGIKLETGLSEFITGGNDSLEAFSAYDDVATFPAEFVDDVFTDGNGNKPSHAIVVRFSDVSSENLVTQDVGLSGGQLELKDDGGLKSDAPLVLVAKDCSEGLLFDSDNGLKTNGKVSGLPAQGDNDINYASFTAGARLSGFMVHGYYIGDSKIIPGTPALMREVVQPDGSTKSEELALGVENIRLEYGELEGGVITYRTPDDAEFESDKVTVVRIGVALRSLEAVHAEKLRADNLGEIYEDRFLRQEVFATVRIRNRNG